MKQMSGSRFRIVDTCVEAEIVCDMLSLKEGEEVQKSASSNREMGSHFEPTRMRRTDRMCDA